MQLSMTPMNTIYNLHKNEAEKRHTQESQARGSFSLIESLHDYTASPLQRVQISNNAYHGLEFEKKICRAGFKKSFGHHLPNPGILEMSFGLYDVGPYVDSSRWKKKRPRNEKAGTYEEDLISTVPSQNIEKGLPLNTDLCFKGYNNNRSAASAYHCMEYQEGVFALDAKTRVRQMGTRRKKRSFIGSGIQLMSAYWGLERCIEEIRKRRSARVVLNELIRDVKVLINYQHSACPVLGVRVTASGRLGKKKKGMAQQHTASFGKIPLGTFSQKVDYSQGFVSTKLGVIGLKVWVAFK